MRRDQPQDSDLPRRRGPRQPALSREEREGLRAKPHAREPQRKIAIRIEDLNASNDK
jgi:hypothetical protein